MSPENQGVFQLMKEVTLRRILAFLQLVGRVTFMHEYIGSIMLIRQLENWITIANLRFPAYNHQLKSCCGHQIRW
jgi:hypothetical protein